MKYHEVGLEEYDELILDYRRGMYKFDIKEGAIDFHSVHKRFEQANADTAVNRFHEGQKKGPRGISRRRRRCMVNGSQHNKSSERKRRSGSRTCWEESPRSRLIARLM